MTACPSRAWTRNFASKIAEAQPVKTSQTVPRASTARRELILGVYIRLLQQSVDDRPPGRASRCWQRSAHLSLGGAGRPAVSRKGGPVARRVSCRSADRGGRHGSPRHGAVPRLASGDGHRDPGALVDTSEQIGGGG